ncbi:MAG: UDP-2,3-diacylglucosamine diphosphatase [Candidatus Lightella neohaematopini]|nr:UDP-2,3-diacylglucosamine diphosphatase [Candidatus Lightella neohaematopini]MCV2528853.1 UDP-2,3-diacylglucosamine diphosphatase [Candidatus Lightella neohaematopini]
MTILFISDVHLSNDKPDITNHFSYFIKRYAINSKALYILGDLFESWIGDDYVDKLSKKIANVISLLNKYNVPCYLIRGNRDFLLDKNYANLCNIKLLPYKLILNYSANKILILHGDDLCTNNINDRIFFRLIRCKLIKYLFLKLPIKVRIKLKNIIRKHSINKIHTSFNINNYRLLCNIKKYKPSIIIHGHIHKEIIINYNNYCHIILGAWYNYGVILEIKNNNIILVKFNIY